MPPGSIATRAPRWGADVDEGADAAVAAPDHDQRRVGALDGAEIESLRHLALVTDEVPHLLEDALALFGEHPFVAVHAPADVVSVGKGRRSLPGRSRS